MDVDVAGSDVMKRKYIVEIDLRDLQSLEHYQWGLEDEANEVSDVVRDILWQICEHERERRREQLGSLGLADAI